MCNKRARLDFDVIFLVSEISLQQCYFNPDYIPKLCYPPTTNQDDAIKGKWVRVGPDLNRQAGWTFLVSPCGFLLIRTRLEHKMTEYLLPAYSKIGYSSHN
jgi:hypothetical protein